MRDVGTCVACASNCKTGHCVGERGDQCTACNSDRTLVLRPSPSGNGTANYGECVTCANNCLPGKCVGKHAWECLACASNKVLIKATDGPFAGKPYGSCMQCAYTCQARACVGEKTWQCTGCPPGRTLVKHDETKPFGYCAANSVVQNQLLQQQIKEQAEEIAMLKDADILSLNLKESDTEGSGSAAGELKRMLAARQAIAQQVKAVSNLQAHAYTQASFKITKHIASLGEDSKDSDDDDNAQTFMAEGQERGAEAHSPTAGTDQTSSDVQMLDPTPPI